MLRGMVFIDHLNFNIALMDLYRTQLGRPSPKLDYNKLFPAIVNTVSNVDFLKAYIFVPKPDEFLMNDINLKKYYDWASGLKNSPFTDVIEGRYISRPINNQARDTMDITNPSTFYKVEKGTDINLAINALSKAFFNSYDVGFFVSADTDYIAVYEMLKRIGKIVIQVSVKGQYSYKIKPYVDKQIILSENLFDKCLRDSNNTTQSD